MGAEMSATRQDAERLECKLCGDGSDLYRCLKCGEVLCRACMEDAEDGAPCACGGQTAKPEGKR